jgi:hypothetical protein
VKIPVESCFWCPLRGVDGDRAGNRWDVCQATTAKNEYRLKDLPLSGFPKGCPLMEGEEVIVVKKPQ